MIIQDLTFGTDLSLRTPEEISNDLSSSFLQAHDYYVEDTSLHPCTFSDGSGEVSSTSITSLPLSIYYGPNETVWVMSSPWSQTQIGAE